MEYGGRLTQNGCICAPPCTQIPKPGTPGGCPPCDTCAGVHAKGVTPMCDISRTGKNPPTNCDLKCTASSTCPPGSTCTMPLGVCV